MRNIAVILAFITLTIGITVYFAGLELHFNADKLDNLFFYSTCAGISLMSYSMLGSFNESANYLLRALCFYFAYLFITFGLDEFIYFNIELKWVYIPTGGLILCLLISALWHLGHLRN